VLINIRNRQIFDKRVVSLHFCLTALW